VDDSYQSVEVTVNGLEVKVITYSVGLERVLVVDRYGDIITDKETAWLNTYLKNEGFLFNEVSRVEVVKSV
tara:strand:- start:1277 stop:1489 length:213 start_codon:yes stop_codon:yes gene_type:complete